MAQAEVCGLQLRQTRKMSPPSSLTSAADGLRIESLQSLVNCRDGPKIRKWVE